MPTCAAPVKVARKAQKRRPKAKKKPPGHRRTVKAKPTTSRGRAANPVFVKKSRKITVAGPKSGC
jgi:hypothetical protein